MKCKDNAKPVFMKPHLVPFAVQEKLNETYDAGIKKGVWKGTETQSSHYSIPVVLVRKICHAVPRNQRLEFVVITQSQ